jgi:hypothetical protein
VGDNLILILRYSIDGLKIKTRQGNGNRGRLRIIGNLKLTDRDKLYYRITNNHAIGSIGKESASISGIGTVAESYPRSGDSTEVRVRFSHKHDWLNGTSRLHYQNRGGDYTGFSGAEHNLEYQFQIPLAEYFFDNDFIKTTTFTVAPKLGILGIILVEQLSVHMEDWLHIMLEWIYIRLISFH